MSSRAFIQQQEQNLWPRKLLHVTQILYRLLIYNLKQSARHMRLPKLSADRWADGLLENRCSPHQSVFLVS
jgi:hypothetical protein